MQRAEGFDSGQRAKGKGQRETSFLFYPFLIARAIILEQQDSNT